jgi:glycosyltransferase involved in cell wall biosynthesis
MVASIDVVMPTCNSNKPYLLPVLKAVKKNIPLNKIIIIDCFSNDGTVELISKFFRRQALILRTHANLAYARYLGIKFVETDIFAMIDSDTMILPYWYEKLYRILSSDKKIGAVEGRLISSSKLTNQLPLTQIYDRSIILEKKKVNELSPTFILRRGLWWYVRGETTNVLIRREVVKDWKPLDNLGAFEDFHLTQHVLRKGYKWVRYEGGVVAIHFELPKNPTNSLILKPIRKGLWHGSNIFILLKSKELDRKVVLLDNIREITNSALKLFYKRGKEKYIISLLFAIAVDLGILVRDRYAQQYRRK